MSILPIQTGVENPILRRKATKVERVTKDLKKLIADMRQTVKAENGMGLAAPQVGESLRLCLALVGGRMTVFINPERTWRSEETDTQEEGCLSLPGLTVAVERPVGLIVAYTDEKGKERERRLTGLDARVIQHEMDHLEGRLLADYLSDPAAILMTRKAV